jgi:hypothetical protein
MQIFITIDTELWPFMVGWPDKRLPSDKVHFTPEIDTYIHGKTPQGEFGIAYQLALFKQFGLKATFFVEPFCARRIGLPALSQWVRMIQDADQEIGLHPHTEWLSEVQLSCLDTGHRQFIHNYSEDDQTCIVKEGMALLEMAGAPKPAAYRAGGYGADVRTLRALARNDIFIDSSYNPTAPYSFPNDKNMPTHGPQQIEKTWELPIAYFNDYPGHFRHAQLCAASFPEMRAAIMQAAQSGFQTFVIVLHSGELVKKIRRGADLVDCAPATIVIRRLEKLCEFLAQNHAQFETAHFRDLKPTQWSHPKSHRIPKTGMARATMRMTEQLLGRFF